MQFNQYVFIILWIGVFAVFAKFSPALKRKETVLGVDEERFSWWIVFLLLIPLVYIAATRMDYGDTWNYKVNFRDNMPESLGELSSYMDGIKKDSLFYLFSSLIKIFITKDYVVYFGILAAIQLFCVFSVFRKYSTDFVLSVFLFVVSADYFSWTHNGIRQFTAVTIIFAFTALILKKKYLPLILIIFFASMFHKSALFMLPVVFFVQGEAWNKKNTILLFVVIVIVAFIGSFTNLLDNLLSDTQYKNVVSDYQGWNDDGTNPFRVAVYSVPTVISFIQRKEIKKNGNKLINICANMSIVTSAVYVVSMVTSGVFFGRMPIYTSLYNYILLPWELEHWGDEDNKKIVFALMVILYLIYYYYQMHIEWNII